MVARDLLERFAVRRIRATGRGRLVLNAIVVELARSFAAPSVVQEVEQARGQA